LLDSIRVDEAIDGNDGAGTPHRGPRGGDRGSPAAAGARDVLLHRFFRRHPAMGQQDRAFIADALFAWLRRRRSLEALAQNDRSGASRARGHGPRARHRAAGARRRVRDTDDAWVRAFKSRPRAAARTGDRRGSSRLALGPAWRAYGDADREALAHAWLAAAPLDVRVNALKMTREEARRALEASGIDAARPRTRRLACASADARHSARIRCSRPARSRCRTRAASSSAISCAPKRSEMVVDFCAGAGGKTLILGALMRSHGRCTRSTRTSSVSRR
jgi:16S rRNA (cytosine967-C5)-methyltransferase